MSIRAGPGDAIAVLQPGMVAALHRLRADSRRLGSWVEVGLPLGHCVVSGHDDRHVSRHPAKRAFRGAARPVFAARDVPVPRLELRW